MVGGGPCFGWFMVVHGVGTCWNNVGDDPW